MILSGDGHDDENYENDIITRAQPREWKYDDVIDNIEIGIQKQLYDHCITNIRHIIINMIYKYYNYMPNI